MQKNTFTLCLSSPFILPLPSSPQSEVFRSAPARPETIIRSGVSDTCDRPTTDSAAVVSASSSSPSEPPRVVAEVVLRRVRCVLDVDIVGRARGGVWVGRGRLVGWLVGLSFDLELSVILITVRRGKTLLSRKC